MNSNDWIHQIIHNADLVDKYELALKKDSSIERQLLKIKENYMSNRASSYSKKCESTAQQLLMVILTADELKDIHSARYRIKTLDSLVIKYIKKKAALPKEPGMEYSIEKYRPMNKDNYYKIITDLIGIRILIRYQQQWRKVHDWICNNFSNLEKPYITNWLDDYPAGCTEDFIVEKPKLYLRDKNELPLYQKEDEDLFEVHVSDEGYSSLHYLLWYDGKYVEVQVRTIYDEAWGECTHDLVYKCKIKNRRAELERLSRCLAIQTQAAGMIADFMYEKSQGSVQREMEKPLETQISVDFHSKTYENLERRIRKMPSEQKDIFDGSIDNLL